MELEARLRAFAAFARRRSFSAAARELRISQPAVSKHIAEVEREAGVRLVERRPRGGDLTPAGEFLANHVLRAQALLSQAARGVAEFREEATGSLVIAASGVPATYLLPEVVIAFQREHPGVRVSIERGPSAQMVDSLRSHRAELGVVGGFAATAVMREHWTYRRKRLVDLLDGRRVDRIGLVPVTGDAPALWEAWVGMGGEGIVLKDRGSIYRPGVRSSKLRTPTTRLTVTGW